MLTPADPARVDLPRGLSGLIPTALWVEEGHTLPRSPNEGPATEEAPIFDELAAGDYSLADRGTRLLAVLRVHAVLRSFFPQAVADLRGPLVRALCRAAEFESSAELAITLEALASAAGDANAALLTLPGDRETETETETRGRRRARRRARRWHPALSLGWVEERVVVAPAPGGEELAAGLRAGDVLIEIDGEAIESLLAAALARTPAATASARVTRALSSLLERGREDASISVALLRQGPRAEERVELTLRADQRADHPSVGADARPSAALGELREGIIYADATRLRRLDALARKLHVRRRRLSALILDLRGELADPRGSLLAHVLREPAVVLAERLPTGPERDATLALEPFGERRVEPASPRLELRLAVLIDERTRGRAELEAAGFDSATGALLVGSASAGDLARSGELWLPGGWQLRFSESELRRPDGSALWGRGVQPTLSARPDLEALRGGVDRVLQSALDALG